MTIEQTQPAVAGQVERRVIHDGDMIYHCKFCGSVRMYQVFKVLGCLDCCKAYSVDDHV